MSDEVGVRNVGEIVKGYTDEPLVVVVSAMGKMTNALEVVYQNIIDGDDEMLIQTRYILLMFVSTVIDKLFPEGNKPLRMRVDQLASPMTNRIHKNFDGDKDALYDEVVAIGELWSTAIVSEYLNSIGVKSKWMDARRLIKTDNHHREGRVNWDTTCNAINKAIHIDSEHTCVYVTQGFIASDDQNATTTLGREGSDYSAAIIANCLDAKEVTIWKDVPGVLNADPKIFADAVKRENVSFHEAIELAYYGASVIHPRTIQPLQQKAIDLWVKSFLKPDERGTLINESAHDNHNIPSYITQKGQWLITIATRDLSFIIEEHLTAIFACFARNKVKIDIMQNSAVNFSIAAHNKAPRMLHLIDELRQDFDVKYNENLELLTIRHYNDDIIKKLTAHREILMEQRTRQTYRVLLGLG